MHWVVAVTPISGAFVVALWNGCRAFLAFFLLVYAMAFGVHEASKREADRVLHDLYQSGLTRIFFTYAARSLGSVLIIELLFGSTIPRCIALPLSQLIVLTFTATHTHGISHLDRLAVVTVAGIAVASVLAHGKDKFKKVMLYLAWMTTFFIAHVLEVSCLIWNILIFAAVWTL